jgi:hypothetical protein
VSAYKIRQKLAAEGTRNMYKYNDLKMKIIVCGSDGKETSVNIAT